jgi:uncharacterized protein YcfJ|tara:strand:- start:90 stop:539 length:450 start_codon:yes stop_codon:yes gene_type:complete
MNKNVKRYISNTVFWGGLITAGVLMVSTNAKADDTEVFDNYKNIIYKTPSNVEVCYDRQVSGDKTSDTIIGGIIGGVIGNNVTKNMPDGGTAGAIIGSIIGNMNSNASGGTKTICQVETRYTEESKKVYSHSTINFVYNGKQYTLNFKK